MQVSFLIPFIWFQGKGCFKSFPVIKYTYVPCPVSFKEYAGLKIFFILSSILRGIWKTIFP